jgi:hypothetical protein
MKARLEQVAPESIAITGFLQLVQVSKLPPVYQGCEEKRATCSTLRMKAQFEQVALQTVANKGF